MNESFRGGNWLMGCGLSPSYADRCEGKCNRCLFWDGKLYGDGSESQKVLPTILKVICFPGWMFICLIVLLLCAAGAVEI